MTSSAKVSLGNNLYIIPKARHTADGEALITALVFLKLLDRFERKGTRRVGQLVK